MKKFLICFIILVSMISNLITASAENDVTGDSTLVLYQPFHDVIDVDNMDDIAYGVIANVADGKCADIDYEDLTDWLNVYWNFSYDRVVAPLQDSALSGDYIKLWNKDKSQSYTVFPNGGIIVGEYGDAYESQGITKQNYVWYLPTINNSRTALNSANETLKHIYFYKTYEGYKDREREITEADKIEISSNNLLITDTASEWAQSEIQKAAACNLMVYDLFEKYTQPITRYEFCRLAYRLIATEVEPYSDSRVGIELAIGSLLDQKGISNATDNKFSDCYYTEVEALASMGIIEGMGDGTFAPDSNITREQAATILYRMAEFLNKNPHSPSVAGYPSYYFYDDLPAVSDWATTAVLAMKKMGVMNGVIDTIFLPSGLYTTEQAIATMVRLYEYN